MSVLEVHDVSIRYLTGDFKDIGLKEYVMRKATHNYHVHVFWADRDVDFTLEKGDMLGIIGVNGAGKSTLLKVISGIMEPTKGWVKREGNIAALLELASGFDGDLTVRENTFLRGALLGYTRKFMEETYEQIIDFAELRDFQDRPFKELSSGMKSRLAFAIASLVEPDILILDEVLSVGDGAFQTKSAAKMRQIIESGATTILVSHAIGQVREMCNKVLWLHKGRQVAFGDNVEEICDRYEAFLAGDPSQLGEAYFQAEKADSQEKARQEEQKAAQEEKPPKEPSPPAKWGKSLIMVLVLCAVMSIAVLFHIRANFEDPIDYAKDYVSPLELGWTGTEGSVSVDEDSATLYYSGESEMVWFHMFEWSTRLYSIPESSLVPDDAKQIQFDCQLMLPRGLTVVGYLQQFDKNSERIDEATLIETVNTEAITPDNGGGETISFPYSISAQRHEQCVAYSILFDIRPEGKSGSFSVIDTDTIFK